jgi:hypothetical protein
MLGCKVTAPTERPRMPGVVSCLTPPRFLRVAPKKPSRGYRCFGGHILTSLKNFSAPGW